MTFDKHLKTVVAFLYRNDSDYIILTILIIIFFPIDTLLPSCLLSLPCLDFSAFCFVFFSSMFQHFLVIVIQCLYIKSNIMSSVHMNLE